MHVVKLTVTNFVPCAPRVAVRAQLDISPAASDGGAVATSHFHSPGYSARVGWVVLKLEERESVRPFCRTGKEVVLVRIG